MRVKYVFRGNSKVSVKVYMMVSLLFLVLVGNIIAQENDRIILTVQLNEVVQEVLDEGIFNDFEITHPNVDINVIYESEYVLPAHYDVSEHLTIVDRLTVNADVFITTASPFGWLSPETTRSGYFLDLLPLFNASFTDNPSEYYPIVWQSAQWDGGLWLLPTSTTIIPMIYDIEAFDVAGLSYPDENWTLNNFINAVNVLSTRDATGYITRPGFSSFNAMEQALYSRFLSQPLYDSSQVPFTPQIMRSDTIDLASQWTPALSSGAIANLAHDYKTDFYFGSEPLRLLPLTDVYFADSDQELAFAPLPGGGALVNPTGFAVSSRTQNPQLAYELASYLAANIDISHAVMLSHGGTSLARPNYEFAPDTDLLLSPWLEGQEAIPFIDDALQNGLPSSSTFYGFYLLSALFSAANEDVNIEDALRDSEALARENLAIAEARSAEVVGVVSNPVPEIILAPHEIELIFYHREGDNALWQTFADEFVANDPELGRVVMQSPSSNFDFHEEDTDCFYSYSNLSPASDDFDYVIDISPLLASDTEFVAEDWLTGVFDTVRQDNGIYALPMDIRPFALWYDVNQLESQGLLAPRTNSELLEALRIFNNGDSASLSSFQLDTTLLMLIASQGAVPIIYEGDRVRIDFTSENSIPTIRQILDLARDGTIKYGSLTDFTSSSLPEFEPFITDFVVDSLFRDDEYLPIPFPAGNEYTPVAYSLMAGYISRFSQHREACYRLLRSLSERHDLLGGIPAQHSVATRSEYTDFYEEFSQQLNAPNLVVIQGDYQGNAHFVKHWLYRAFDHYVLEGADLESELSIAEQFTNEYLLCVENGGASYDCAL